MAIDLKCCQRKRCLVSKVVLLILVGRSDTIFLLSKYFLDVLSGLARLCKLDKVLALKTETVTDGESFSSPPPLFSVQNQLLLKEEALNMNIDDKLRFESLDILYKNIFPLHFS